MKKTKITALLAASILAVGLSACGTSHLSKIDSAGQSTDLVWPEIKPGGWMQSGTFPNLENLRHVNVGMTKDQLMAALGYPHFNEGQFGVREWDYIFNFRTGNGAEYVTCQYKVLFDKDKLAQSFHWRDAKCADYIKEKAAPVATAAAAPIQRVQLSADALFAFNRSGVNDILDEGRVEIEKVARQISELRAPLVVVTGHTDEIGSADANLRLSDERAKSVRQVLIDNGVEGSIVMAIGAGESSPVKACDSTASRDAYVACLQPNRRVELELVGLK